MLAGFAIGPIKSDKGRKQPYLVQSMAWNSSEPDEPSWSEAVDGAKFCQFVDKSGQRPFDAADRC